MTSAASPCGVLTNDLITREIYYDHACTLALIPFLTPDLHGDAAF